MRLVRPFDPIAIGEYSDFAFDFLLDIGKAKLVSGAFTCVMAPNQVQTDPSAQSRVISVSIENVILVRSPIDGSLQPQRGAYVVARIGGMPETAIGGVYLLGASARLSDGRVLVLSSSVLCASAT